jgi:hypothetical protein
MLCGARSPQYDTCITYKATWRKIERHISYISSHNLTCVSPCSNLLPTPLPSQTLYILPPLPLLLGRPVSHFSCPARLQRPIHPIPDRHNREHNSNDRECELPAQEMCLAEFDSIVRVFTAFASARVVVCAALDDLRCAVGRER